MLLSCIAVNMKCGDHVCFQELNTFWYQVRTPLDTDSPYSVVYAQRKAECVGVYVKRWDEAILG